MTKHEQMKILHDFAFGDTRGVREVMLSHAKVLTVTPPPWETFGYPDHEGNAKLIELTQNLIKDLTKHSYEHVIITNGATNAISAAIYSMRSVDSEYLWINTTYFGFYPDFGWVNNLEPKKADFSQFHKMRKEDIALLDSPSNPLGIVTAAKTVKERTIWDAAYWSGTYMKGLEKLSAPPKHEVMVGSYNKLTGINGLRVGWLATDSKEIADQAYRYVTNNLCGVTASGQWAVEKILETVDLDKFYKESAKVIDNNKTEIERLGYLFGNQHIPNIGMFVLWDGDKDIAKLVNKAGVKFLDGHKVGGKLDSLRINLGNTNLQTKDMVDAILKADGK